MKKGYKTTPEHFKIFKEECQKWREIFGLNGWEFSYDHEKDEDGNLAWYVADVAGRCATVGLGVKWNIAVTTSAIKRASFHEICEVFLGRIKSLAETRYIRVGETGEEIHQIIRTLEHVIFDKW